MRAFSEFDQIAIAVAENLIRFDASIEQELRTRFLIFDTLVILREPSCLYICKETFEIIENTLGREDARIGFEYLRELRKLARPP